MAREISVNGFNVNINHTTIADGKLAMDFQPVVNAIRRKAGNKPFVFLHWQAKPIGVRTWGVFSVNAEGQTKYLSSENIEINSTNSPSTIQINEVLFKVKPTAGLLWINSESVERDGRIYINDIGTDTVNNRLTDNSVSVGRISTTDISGHSDRIIRAKARAKAARGSVEASKGN